MFQFPKVLVAAILATTCGVAPAQSIAPSALLAIDQNRTTVVDRIVSDWGDALTRSNASITAEQLREMLLAMRADQLVAASLAGSVNGLRDVLANALTSTAPIAPGLIHTKALGDSTAELVYTPIMPCRLADTRVAGGALGANAARDFTVWVWSGGFTAQGGDAGNCNVPANPAAVVLNVAAVNPQGLGNLIAYATGGAWPNTSVLNYQLGTFALSNGTIVPACTPDCANQVTVKTNGAGTDVVLDVVGYFKPPGNATGLTILANGEQVMRYEYNASSPNLIGGSSANNVTTGAVGAVIGGGGASGTQVVLPDDGPVDCTFPLGGACANRVTDMFGTVGGGVANQAGHGPEAMFNVAFATVGGGRGNTASSWDSTVAGGSNNSASGGASNVAGGYLNTASGWWSTIAGGWGNSVTGLFSTVAGGNGNRATGNFSTVAGGNGNTASGAYSLAAGRRAKTQSQTFDPPSAHDGTFVWADSNDFDFTSSASNEFAARATGGVRFVLGIDGTGAPTWTCSASNGSGWACSSDRNLKENLLPVDSTNVLQSVATLPLYFWNAKSADPAIRHVGPMAHDFHAAFGLGDSDKTIGMQDADGIALAAIQGLYQLVQERDARIAALEQQVSELRSLRGELAALRTAVAKLVTNKTTTTMAQGH